MVKELIGTGVLNWRKHERVSDRYGMVCLYVSIDSEDTVKLKKLNGLGKLIAIVKENRQSSHIGDMFHGFYPSIPKIGEEIELGIGWLTYDEDEFGEVVGVNPDDDRTTFWLNPVKLYRCHEQTVELYFEEEA